MLDIDNKNRTNSGNIASIVGILVNILLAGVKVLVGLIFGVISLFADGLNNFTDCGSSIISLISFKLSSKPADKEHPFGHERIEYICSIVVAFIILLIAISIAIESVNKIIAPPKASFSIWIVLALVLSVCAKLGLYFYYKTVAKKLNSSILKAAAVDSLTDCISTSTVFVSLIVGLIFNINIDGYAGVAVSIFIGFSAVNILKEVFSVLIGKAPDNELLLDIKQKILSYPGVLGVHDISVYSYGPNKYFASVHVEVDAAQDVLTSHELIDDIEKDFLKSTGIMLTGHLDPIVTDDERVNTLKKQVEEIVCKIDATFSIHDFRMVFGVNTTNVLFDLAIPYDSKMTKDEIKNILEKEITAINCQYCLVLTIEHCI